MRCLFKLISIFYIMTLPLSAQIEIQDAYTKKGISNAKIFSKAGEIIGTSNLKGSIKIPKHTTIQKADTVEVFHSNYISEKMTWTNILERSVILMKPDTLTKFEEVIVVAKKPEILILKGNFISYQIIDNIPLTFRDGIIEYYIDLKKKKFLKSNIIASRSFKNFKTIRKFNAQKKNSTRNVLSTLPPFNFIEEVILSDLDKFNISKEGVITRKATVIGSLKTEGESTTMSIQYHTPDRPRNIVLPGIKSTIYNKIINESFSTSFPKLEKILSINKYYNSAITKKDVTIRYELVEDFYTLEKKTMSKAQFKNYLNTLPKLKSDTLTKTDSKIPKVIKALLFKELKLQ